jgi:hypothetical protein
LEKPFSAVGTVRLAVNDPAGDGHINVGSQVFDVNPDIVYDVSIAEHIPGEIVEVAHKDRAASGVHYLIRHKDGTPLDPLAKFFVLRLDTDEDALAALSFYMERRTFTAAVAKVAALEEAMRSIRETTHQQAADLAEYGRRFGELLPEGIVKMDDLYKLDRDVPGLGQAGEIVERRADGQFHPLTLEEEGNDN